MTRRLSSILWVLVLVPAPALAQRPMSVVDLISVPVVSVAPAFSYSASGNRAASPAPRSMATAAPSPISLVTVSGVAATRVSPSARSRTMAIFMDVS